jgi:hypothetical protein
MPGGGVTLSRTCQSTSRHGCWQRWWSRKFVHHTLPRQTRFAHYLVLKLHVCVVCIYVACWARRRHQQAEHHPCGGHQRQGELAVVPADGDTHCCCALATWLPLHALKRRHASRWPACCCAGQASCWEHLARSMRCMCQMHGAYAHARVCLCHGGFKN